MKKIIEFFKKLFGGKVEEPKVYSTSSVRKPSTNSKSPQRKPQPTGLPKVKDIEVEAEVVKPKPKKKRYYKPKPKQGGSSTSGKQPYNTK